MGCDFGFLLLVFVWPVPGLWAVNSCLCWVIWWLLPFLWLFEWPVPGMWACASSCVVLSGVFVSG